MENNLVSSLSHFLKHHGTSIEELNLLDSSNVDNDFGSLAYRLFFSKSDNQIWEEAINAKKEIYSQLYGVDFCPFERLTGVSWEEMFRAAIAPKGDELDAPCKIFNSWFHFTLSSTDFYHDTPFVAENKETILLDFSYVGGGEHVKIDNVLYCYGEARICSERQIVKKEKIHTKLFSSTVVIDWRFIDALKQQREHHLVLQKIYVLYFIAGHSAILHSLFLETSNSIREKISKDPVMSKLNSPMYFSFDGHEINYNRMHKRMFELMCKENPSLHHDTIALVSEICSLTKNWDLILREYIQFIAHERANRIINLGNVVNKKEKYITAPFRSGGKITQPEWGDLHHFTHNFPNHEAIVADGESLEMGNIPYKDMTRFMFDLYKK